MSELPSDYALVLPYDVLAEGYDLVMEHVDYAEWADYVQEVFERHADRPVETILELGCGTGALAGQLQPQGPYRYLATDGSAAMIARAHDLMEDDDALRFEVQDFRAFVAPEPADAVLLLYDGLNYLLSDDDVRALVESAHASLRPGGLFVFDQSTPANSENNAAYFEDEGEEDGFAYVRRSAYDRATRLHTTTFEIETAAGRFCEQHVEKAYTLAEVRALVEPRFAVVAAYDGFTFEPATERSERVHWVVRR